MGKWLPPNIRARGDSPLVLSTTATMPEDPSAVSPSVQLMSRAVIWATGGAGRTVASGAATVAFDYGPPIMATTTSACVGGASSAYVAPAAVGAMRAVGSSDQPIVGSGTASIAGSPVTSEGALRAPTSACPTEGTGVTMGGA